MSMNRLPFGATYFRRRFSGQLSEGVGQSLEFAAARQRGVEACRLVWRPLAIGELAQLMKED